MVQRPGVLTGSPAPRPAIPAPWVDALVDATVGVVFGPQYGPITAKMIEEVIRPAARRYDDLVFAGFSFDGPRKL